MRLEKPFMLYTLAAHHGLDDLATSTSARRHISFSCCYMISQMIYLKRLMNLHMQRTELLGRLLIQPLDTQVVWIRRSEESLQEVNDSK